MKNLLIGTLIAVMLTLVLGPTPPAPSFGAVNAAVVEHVNRPLHANAPAQPKPKVAAEAPKTFGGYPCEGDCSVQKAGYGWAEREGIVDPDSCIGNSGAFAEGCRVYAEERSSSQWNR